MKQSAGLLILFAVLMAGPGLFVRTKLDPSYKAEALTRQGADLYQQQLVELERIDQIPSVRKYFAAALNYAPDNQEARKYLVLTDGFKESLVDKYLEAAEKIKGKKATERQLFKALIDLDRALSIDKKSIPARKLADELKEEKIKLLELFKKEALASSAVFELKKGKEKDAAALETWQAYHQSARLGDKKAQKKLQSFQSYLDKKFDKAASAVRFATDAKNFSAASDAVERMNNAAYRSELEIKARKIEHDFEMAWAQSEFSKKDLKSAKTHAARAALLGNDKAAMQLKAKIEAEWKKSMAGGRWGDIAGEIDENIRSGKFFEAREKIKQALSEITAPERKKELRIKLTSVEERIDSMIENYYADAVKDYNEERFADAVVKFRRVVEYRNDFKDAAVYLKKARQKKSLVEGG